MNDIHSYIFIQSFIHSGHEIDVRIHLLTDGQLLINHILKSCRDFFAIIFFTQYNSREISFNEELGQVHASLLYNGVIFKKKIYILVHWGNLNQILSLKNNWGKGKSKLTLFRKQIETFFPKVSMPTKAESGRVLASTTTVPPTMIGHALLEILEKNKVLLMLATIARVSYVSRSFDVHKLSLSTVRVNLKTVVILKSYQVICQVLFYMF